MDYLGSYSNSVISGMRTVVRIYFATLASTTAPTAPSSALEVADIRVYKNGSATQRASEAGYTMTSPFDSVTGLHLIEIDLTDDTDEDFYTIDNQYTVVLAPDETVNAVAHLQVLGQFDIGVPPVNIIRIGGSDYDLDSAQLGVKVITCATSSIDANSFANDTFTTEKFADGCITAAKIATGAIDADALAADAVAEIQTGLSTLTAAQVWTVALTEAYRATGATGTAAQLLYELLANITDFALSGATKTARKLDGTTAKTYTLDSATSPTSITETT